MKQLNNSHGFSLLHALLVLVIISLVGFVGWRVVHKDSSPATNTMTTSKKPVTIPDDWQWFVSNDKTVRFAYPKAWGTLTTEQAQDSFMGPVVITPKKDLMIQIPKSYLDFTWYFWNKDTNTLMSAEDTKPPQDGQLETYLAPRELGKKTPVTALIDDDKGNVIYHELGKGAMNCGVRHYFFSVKDKVVHLSASLCNRDGEWQPEPPTQAYTDIVETPLKDIHKYVQQ